MHNVKCELVDFKIAKLDCNIDIESEKNKIRLEIKEELSIGEPVEEELLERSLRIKTIISSSDLEEFNITVLSYAIFTLDKKPEDINKYIMDKCFPIAKKRVYESIKDITTAMNMDPLDLVDKVK